MITCISLANEMCAYIMIYDDNHYEFTIPKQNICFVLWNSCDKSMVLLIIQDICGCFFFTITWIYPVNVASYAQIIGTTMAIALFMMLFFCCCSDSNVPYAFSFCHLARNWKNNHENVKNCREKTENNYSAIIKNSILSIAMNFQTFFFWTCVRFTSI